jgi:Flp pilus assembly protein TadD
MRRNRTAVAVAAGLVILLAGFAVMQAVQLRRIPASATERTVLHVLGPEHANTLITMNNLAMDLAAQGRYPEAEKFERETRDIQQRVLGPESPDAALSTYNLGCLAALQGHHLQALSLVREAVDHGLSPSADQNIERDSDLVSLHGEPGFAALVAYAKEKAAAAQNPQ